MLGIRSLKIIVTALFVIFLLNLLDIEKLTESASNIETDFLFMAFFISLLRFPLWGYRWHLILKNQGNLVAPWLLARITFSSFFFVLTLPSGSGSDIARAYSLSKTKISLKDNIGSVIGDRLVGIFCLLLIAIPAGTTVLLSYPDNNDIGIGVIAVSLSMLVVLFAARNLRNSELLQVASRGMVKSVIDSILRGLAEFAAVTSNGKLLGLITTTTVIIHILGILSVYLVGLALGIEVPFLFYSLFVPMIWLLTMIPISIGGIGVRESGYIIFFGIIGLEKEAAVAISLTVFALTVLLSLIGGGVYLLDSNKPAEKP